MTERTEVWITRTLSDGGQEDTSIFRTEQSAQDHVARFLRYELDFLDGVENMPWDDLEEEAAEHGVSYDLFLQYLPNA